MPLPETLSVKNISFGPSAFHLSQAKNQLLPARRGRMAHHGWLEDPAHAKKACLFVGLTDWRKTVIHYTNSFTGICWQGSIELKLNDTSGKDPSSKPTKWLPSQLSLQKITLRLLDLKECVPKAQLSITP